MGEIVPQGIDFEPKQRFTAELKRSMRVLYWELGKSGNFFTALRESQLAGGQAGEVHEPIFFNEPTEGNQMETYEFSDNFRHKEGLEALDAISLKRQDISLFLQYARSEGRKKSASTAELIIGDKVFKGREALDRIHDAFPRFYPAPQLVKVA